MSAGAIAAMQLDIQARQVELDRAYAVLKERTDAHEEARGEAAQIEVVAHRAGANLRVLNLSLRRADAARAVSDLLDIIEMLGSKVAQLRTADAKAKAAPILSPMQHAAMDDTLNYAAGAA